jgi:hypothetical protein
MEQPSSDFNPDIFKFEVSTADINSSNLFHYLSQLEAYIDSGELTDQKLSEVFSLGAELAAHYMPDTTVWAGVEIGDEAKRIARERRKNMFAKFGEVLPDLVRAQFQHYLQKVLADKLGFADQVAKLPLYVGHIAKDLAYWVYPSYAEALSFIDYVDASELLTGEETNVDEVVASWLREHVGEGSNRVVATPAVGQKPEDARVGLEGKNMACPAGPEQMLPLFSKLFILYYVMWKVNQKLNQL